MEIKKIASRGYLFTFYDLGIPTNVYVIDAKKYIYIIDTYIGPIIMQEIMKYIETQCGNKEIIVINSHNHWDHVWGNCFFSSNIIISHVLCKEYMIEDGPRKLEMYKAFRKGDVILTNPNLTFTDRISFDEDDILIYHTPGHTDDSISVIDLEDKVLYAGDNLERPIPYLMSKNLNQYIKSLENYINLDVEIIIGGHTVCEDKNLIRDNLDYVSKVSVNNTKEFEEGIYADYHNTNMIWLSD